MPPTSTVCMIGSRKFLKNIMQACSIIYDRLRESCTKNRFKCLFGSVSYKFVSTILGNYVDTQLSNLWWLKRDNCSVFLIN